MSMVGLGIVLMVSATTGSYAEAGAVSAAFALSSAALAPLGARFVDRWGQRRVVTILVALHVASLLLLVVATLGGSPLPILLVLSAIAGGSMPSVGALVRSRWAALLGGEASLRTAFAFESALDEVIFVLGPPLATALAVAFGASAALVACTALVALGSALLLVQRGTEPPVVRHEHRRQPSLLRSPGLVVVLLAMIATGAVFGSVDVVVVAVSDEAGMRGAAGLVLAAYALGSMGAAFVLGARSHTQLDDRLPRHFLIFCALLALSTICFLAVSTLVGIGVVSLLGGLTVSPVLISAFSLAERLVPETRLTEGLAWAISGIGLGVALAAALAGWLVDTWGPHTGFLVTAAAGTLAFVIVLAGFGTLRRESHDQINRRTPE